MRQLSKTKTLSEKANHLTQIHVYNPLGQRVAVLFDGIQTPGQHSVSFDAAGLPSGMYIVVLESNGFRDMRKVLLVK